MKFKIGRAKLTIIVMLTVVALITSYFVAAGGKNFTIEVTEKIKRNDEDYVFHQQINSTVQDINSTVYRIEDDLSDALSNLSWILDNVATQTNVTTILDKIQDVNSSIYTKLNAMTVTLGDINSTVNNVESTVTSVNFSNMVDFLTDINTSITALDTSTILDTLGIMNVTLNEVDTTTNTINTTVNNIQSDTTSILATMATQTNITTILSNLLNIDNNLTTVITSLENLDTSIFQNFSLVNQYLGDNFTAIENNFVDIDNDFSDIDTYFFNIGVNFTQVFNDFNDIQQNITNMITYLNDLNVSMEILTGQFQRTNESVVINETLINVVLSNTNEIQINYTINVPAKTGYTSEDYLPIKIYYWFIDENNNCISQHKFNSVTPHCEPLIAEGLGQVTMNSTFLVTLKPALDTGNFTVFRELQIDPPVRGQQVWITYSKGVLDKQILVGNPTLNTITATMSRYTEPIPTVKVLSNSWFKEVLIIIGKFMQGLVD